MIMATVPIKVGVTRLGKLVASEINDRDVDYRSSLPISINVLGDVDAESSSAPQSTRKILAPFAVDDAKDEIVVVLEAMLSWCVLHAMRNA